MLFKVKKTLLPCLLAVGNHISYELFVKHVFDTFSTFCSDQIWGVRKVCLEVLPELIAQIKATEHDKLLFCLDFLAKSLSDDSKWVRNQAYNKFGKIIYSVFKKFEKEVPQAIKTKIRGVTDTFYKQDRVENKVDENEEDQKKDESTVEDKLIQSFMNNSESDDIEVVK